jgi:hypothetical protein
LKPEQNACAAWLGFKFRRITGQSILGTMPRP